MVFTIPIFEPMPSQYYIRAVSDRWLGSEAVCIINFQHLILPERHPPHTGLCVSGLPHAMYCIIHMICSMYMLITLQNILKTSHYLLSLLMVMPQPFVAGCLKEHNWLVRASISRQNWRITFSSKPVKLSHDIAFVTVCKEAVCGLT